jgi:hypothetical protein
VLVLPMGVSMLRDSLYSLLQSMKDRCEKEKRRRASVSKRIIVLFRGQKLEEDIRVLQGRLNAEHKRWVVGLQGTFL